MLKNSEIITEICNISIEAGSIINKFYKLKNNIAYKKDQTPLTEADLASNEFIIKSLSKIDSSVPILSEEKLVDWEIRKNWEKYWLIDPLDGTKEFIKKNDEFTVNIALIKNNSPIMGVIYAPALSTLYFASLKKGTYKMKCKKKINSLNNSYKVHTSTKNKSQKMKIICSRSHNNIMIQNWLNKNINKYDIINKGSSLKFCYVAEGAADLYVRTSPSSEWDIAAGHIILAEAGGKITTIDGKKILYNTKENVINPYFIASCNLI